jgi:hypothetical protein
MVILNRCRHHPHGSVGEKEPESDESRDEVFPEHIAGRNDRLIVLYHRVDNIDLLIEQHNVRPVELEELDRVNNFRGTHGGLLTDPDS